MDDSLSIFAAARECGERTALFVGARRYTFAEIAALTRDRLAVLASEREPGAAYPLIGTNTLASVVTLYALLEARIPALLLHPKTTAVEREAEIAATDASEPALPATAAMVLYTSGTTGQPRGAILMRAALLASAAASASNLGWRDDDCWLLAMPLARVGGLSILTRCLIARRAVALAPSFDATLLPELITSYRTTLVSLVPTMLALLLDAHPSWQSPPWLRAVLVGGAAASPALLQHAGKRNVPIVVTYGCTETCSQVVATPYEMRFQAARCGVGRPLPSAEVRVVEGRIEVRGPMRMAGYLGTPPLAPDEWFDTGDLGTFDDQGWLHVHARRADLIVSGGENVYPAEVERVLEDCPGVRTAAVFGVTDRTWGEIVAMALVPEGLPPTEEALLEFLGERLARYKHPRRFVIVESLPQTAAGKLDRAALHALVDHLRPLTASAVR